MSNPRIVFDGNVLDFPEALSWSRTSVKIGGARNVSHGAVTETVADSSWEEAQVLVERIGLESIRDALEDWWAWASQGKPYSFARSGDDCIDRAFFEAASAGDAEVHLDGSASLAVGPFVLRDPHLGSAEVVTVTSIVFPFPPTHVRALLAAPILYAYTADARLRSLDFWPAVVSVDVDRPVAENGDRTYTFFHAFREQAA